MYLFLYLTLSVILRKLSPSNYWINQLWMALYEFFSYKKVSSKSEVHLTFLKRVHYYKKTQVSVYQWKIGSACEVKSLLRSFSPDGSLTQDSNFVLIKTLDNNSALYVQFAWIQAVTIRHFSIISHWFLL